MINKTHKIYGLYDPFTECLRYVGCTSVDLNGRLRRHMCVNNHSFNFDLGSWIIELKKNGTKPVIILIENVSDVDDHAAREAYWINYYMTKGCELCNVNHNKLKIENRMIVNNMHRIEPRSEMVKPLREKLGLTQGQFARKIRTTKKIVDIWESGKFYFASDITVNLFIELYYKTNKGELR